MLEASTEPLALNVIALERKVYPLAKVLFPLAVSIRALERWLYPLERLAKALEKITPSVSR